MLKNMSLNRNLTEELMWLRFEEALKPGIEEARRKEFVDQSFDEIIAEAEFEECEC